MGDKIVILTISMILVIGFGIKEVNAHKLGHRKMVKEGHIIHGRGDSKGDKKVQSMNNVNSIKIVNELCATTTYKNVCIKSMRSLVSKSGNNNNNPQELFRNGVKLALDETTRASNLIPTTLLPIATTQSQRANSAIESCKDLLEQSIDRLKMASHQVAGDLSKTLKDPSAVLNLRLELGDVNTFSTTCLDEFEEAEAPQLQQLMQDGINNAKQLSVNLLDIASTYTF